jgi:restriction system protein
MNTSSKIINLHTSAAEGDVAAALALLKDALAEDQRRINNEGTAAMQRGDYETATSVIDFAKRLQSFEGKVEVLAAEWASLENLRDTATPAVQQIVSKHFFGRQATGESTPQPDFYPYILQALVELGGRASSLQVVDLVGEKMHNILKPADFAVLPSDGKTIRWRNRAMWARNDLVNKMGLMNKTRQGVWEISERGRQWLSQRSRI